MMTNRIGFHWAVPLALCLLFAPQSWTQTQAAKDRHIVIISLDGFASYALQNPLLPLPTLRRLVQEGAVAESMLVVNPAVTWPNHTSMVTGVVPAAHGVLCNGLAVRGGEGKPLRVEPWIDKVELVNAPTLYDAAHGAGLSAAEVDWVAVQNAPAITWSFAERPRADGKIEREMLQAGLVSENDLRDFAKEPILWRDEIWTRAAVHILERHRPNLLLFHLLTTDSAQHRYGADSLAGNSALALADQQVQRILDAVRVAGIQQNTTVLIVSDHGFKTYKKVIRPNAALMKSGLLRVRDGAPEGDAWVIAEGGTAMVYVTRSSNKEQTVATLRGLFGKLQGIARVIGPEEYEPLGYPSPSLNNHMADLVLAAADGYAFDASTQGEPVADVPANTTPGTHGYLSTDPGMNAIFIAWGAGIKPGSKLGAIRNLDVAPTAARLLGIRMPSATGKVLIDALKEKP